MEKVLTSNPSSVCKMRGHLLTLGILLFSSFFSSCQFSEPADYIALPALFSDHMVLQRHANITIWGKATPHGEVVVSFKNQKSQIIAGADSSWRVMLAPEPAGGPFELTVSGRENIVFSDVLVGEVWLASGQSNMEWPLQRANNAEEEIAMATDDKIRLFTVPKTMAIHPASRVPGESWKVTSPETIRTFSAVAYFFGKVLRDSLQVPVGLIHSSWGGTPAEAWTSASSLEKHPDYVEAVAALKADPARFELNEPFNEWMQAIKREDSGYEDETPAWAATDLDDASWLDMRLPQYWENNALPGFDGVVWFRRPFSLPAAWEGKSLIIELAKVDNEDQTWVNGAFVGATNQANLPRKYAIPASALNADKNWVTVRVFDQGSNGGIWGEAAEMSVYPDDNADDAISLAGNWKYRPAVDLKSDKLPPRPLAQQHTPTVLYNAMIHPLIPFALKGVIWYQGESNASRAYQYQTLFPLLIEDWRHQWGSPIAFHFVQLANFMKQQENPVETETWPELREAQTKALNLANTGMAVTIDIGQADDIHPTNKQDVGRRLALSALNLSYGHSNTPAGPLFDNFEIEGNAVRILFKYAENGLKTQPGNTVRGFAIAGEDQVFYAGEARLEGNDVVVSNSKVSSPVAVRYGWANNPVVNLYNVEGLPASPFRTDDWPGITVGVK